MSWTATFDVRDFAISPDRHDIVLEQVQEHSDVVLLEVPRPRNHWSSRIWP